MCLKQLFVLLSLSLITKLNIFVTNFVPDLITVKSVTANFGKDNSTALLLAQTQSEANSTTKQRPAPPPRIPPNRVKPGGGLDFGQQACRNDTESLVALVPVDNPVLTTQAYPSFLFYIPDTATAISHGEFSILTADEKTRIYATTVTISQTPGIIKIDVPTSQQNALKEAELYHWYFRIHCQSSGSNSPGFLDVDGWIQRVPLTPDRQLQIETASPAIWYDAIALAADNLINSPQSLTVRDRWQKLLQHINLEQLGEVLVVEVSPQ
ncbi:MAG TPA: DUF928 domain-containing protein [Xenococcaceae cyanobacterium]